MTTLELAFAWMFGTLFVSATVFLALERFSIGFLIADSHRDCCVSSTFTTATSLSKNECRGMNANTAVTRGAKSKATAHNHLTRDLNRY